MFANLKSKITKILFSSKIQKGKSLTKWQNQKLKHIKRMKKQQSNFWLGTDIFLGRKVWTKHGL